MITPQCVTDQGSHVMVTGVGIIVSSTCSAQNEAIAQHSNSEDFI